MQRTTAEGKWRNGGNLALGEVRDEGVLLADCLVAPAAGAVELHDDRRRILDADLVYAVLVAVEGEHAAVGPQTDAFDGVQDQVGSQRFKGQGGHEWRGREIGR